MKHVVAYMQEQLRATGMSAEEVCDRAAGIPPDLVRAVLTGRSPLPMNFVAELAKASGADPLLLLRYCLADTAPKTLEAVESRFEDALTHDEMLTIRALRRATASPYIASMSAQQEKKLREWLSTLVDATTVIH